MAKQSGSLEVYRAHGLSAANTCHRQVSLFVVPPLQVPRGGRMLVLQTALLPTIGHLSWALGVGYGHFLQEVPSHWQYPLRTAPPQVLIISVNGLSSCLSPKTDTLSLISHSQPVTKFGPLTPPRLGAISSFLGPPPAPLRDLQ